ncbi:MAG TPA: DMT family transporter [archaeon]|nr:DMT family transporter [archaeon]
MEQKIAILGLLFACFVWAITGVTFKIFTELGVSIAVILFAGIFFRFITVWFIADYKKVKHEWVKDKRELKFVILNGLFSLGTPVFFILAISHTTLSNAYFIAFTAPAWVLVGAVFFLGEKLTTKKILGLFLTMLGIFFISNPEKIFSIDAGIGFAFLAALSFSGDIITGRELKDYSYHTVALYSNAVQLLSLAIAIPFFFSIPSLDFNIFTLWPLAVLGLFRGVSSDIYYYALERLEASTVAIVSLAELFFGSILAYFIFSEIPMQNEFVGYILIFVSGLIIILRKSDIEDFEYLLHLRRKH